MVTRIRVTALVAAAAVGVVGLAGCGGAGQQDAENSGPTAAAASSAAASPDRAPADALPAGFPSEVPLINGTYTSKPPPLQGTSMDMWLLSVADPGANAVQRARQLLLDAGFAERNDGHPVDCPTSSSFDKSIGDDGKSDAYTVTLCPTGVPAPNAFTMNSTDFQYVISVIHLGGDAPALPSLDLPEPPKLGG